MRDNLALVSWWVDYPPFSLTQARFWFSKVINWLGDVLQEYGIKLNVVNEYGTSRQCSICNMKHENGRVKRGLYICPITSIKINADLNAARNIAKKAGYETPMPTKILSFIVTTNGVKPLTPMEGVTTKTPTVKTPPQKGEEGVMLNNTVPY